MIEILRYNTRGTKLQKHDNTNVFKDFKGSDNPRNKGSKGPIIPEI